MADKSLPTDVMSAEEFKQIRNDLGINITHAALLLNMANARTIRRYEDNETPVSGAAGILMRVMRDVPGAFEFVNLLAKNRQHEQ